MNFENKHKILKNLEKPFIIKQVIYCIKEKLNKLPNQIIIEKNYNLFLKKTIYIKHLIKLMKKKVQFCALWIDRLNI